MRFSSTAEVRTYCEREGVKMIDFKVVDITGRLRHLTFPVSRFADEILHTGIGFDGSNYGYASLENSDMVFVPDLETAMREPYTETPTLSMLGNVLVIEQPHNRPFDQYPRNVARRAEEYLRQSGVADSIMLGPEFEVYILDSVWYRASPEQVSYTVDSVQGEWNSGCSGINTITPHKGGYHLAPPQDATFDLRQRVSLLLEDHGVPVKYHHHEVGGPAQIEIELGFDTLSRVADHTLLVKYLMRNEAAAIGKSATFLPKPIQGEAGSGMHVHIQLFRQEQPVFYDPEGYAGLSRTALHFIGGMLAHARSLCGLTNPSTNSYRRLVPGYEAPVIIGYASANRSAVVRIPAYAKSPAQKRFELRSLDATCNPYYAYSAILMAGLDGIAKQIDPMQQGWGPYDCNLFDMSREEQAKLERLPRSLPEALQALEQDHDYLTAGGVFPPELLQLWRERKYAEAQAVEAYPHPAEMKFYYDL